MEDKSKNIELTQSQRHFLIGVLEAFYDSFPGIDTDIQCKEMIKILRNMDEEEYLQNNKIGWLKDEIFSFKEGPVDVERDIIATCTDPISESLYDWDFKNGLSSRRKEKLDSLCGRL